MRASEAGRPGVAYVALGSNLGRRRRNLQRALDKLDAHPDIAVRAVSSFIETEPVGGPAQGKFINAAAELRTAADKGQYQSKLVEELLKATTEEGGDARTITPWPELLPLPGTIGSGKILLGCSNSAIREALHNILATEGHEIVGLDSEDAVLAAVEGQNPDLVLLDVHLPGRGGIEVSREIKARPETEFLPVILVTAQHELDARYRGTRVGADDFLFLPINRLELKARVKSLLRLRMYFKDLEEHHSVILSLASALEAKDPYTRGHSERVGVLAAQLGRTIGLEEEECERRWKGFSQTNI